MVEPPRLPESGPGLFVPAPAALNRKLPLWYQMAQSLRAAILARHAGDPLRLPTEDDLARHYGVSVVTARHALTSLADEGLITRHRRRGTFIDPGVPPSRALQVLGTVDTVVSQQVCEQVEVLGRARVPVPDRVARHFPDLDEVVMFRRLRFDDGVPTSHAENFVPPHVAEWITEQDLRDWPMTRVLRDRVGLRIAGIVDSARALLATPEIARLLDVPVDAPILHYTGVTADEHGAIADVAHIHYRAEAFTFTVAMDFA